VKLRGVAEREAVRFVAPTVGFLTRGPAGILGRGLADILTVVERGEEGETAGAECGSMWRPAWVGVDSGVGFMEPNAPLTPRKRLQDVSGRGVRACVPGRQAGVGEGFVTRFQPWGVD
jgi:hypothetical protein